MRKEAAAREHFAGKVAVVTGAGSGIGRATAVLLARLGCAVHASDLNGESAAAVAAEIESAGGRAVSHMLDVADAEAVEALAGRVFAAEGAVDVLHNNAGIGHGGAVEDTTAEDWRKVIEINVLGVGYGVQAFVPRMLQQGRPGHIVNTASLAGLTAVANMVPYCASKHAVVGLSESLNAELSPRGITVTALCPGIIDTPITASAVMGGSIGERREEIQRFYRRFGGTADDVAEAAVDAVLKKQLIRTVPRSHAFVGWGVRRLSPRAGQPLSRLIARFMMADR